MMKKIFFPLLFCCLLFSTNAFAQKASAHIQADPAISSLLSLQAQMIKQNKLGDRYCIQLISSRSLSNAKEIKNEFLRKFGRRPVQVKYESPNYKVWVGHFTSRLAAERLFRKIKSHYKSAIVLKPVRQ